MYDLFINTINLNQWQRFFHITILKSTESFRFEFTTIKCSTQGSIAHWCWSSAASFEGKFGNHFAVLRFCFKFRKTVFFFFIVLGSNGARESNAISCYTKAKESSEAIFERIISSIWMDAANATTTAATATNGASTKPRSRTNRKQIEKFGHHNNNKKTR